MTWMEIVVSVFVVGLVLFAMWRAGQMNPVGTGKLARRLSTLETTVGAQGQRMDGIDKSITAIAETVEAMGSGVSAIGTQITALRVEVSGDRGLTERTWSAVSRLEGFFIEDSFKQRGRP